VEQISRDQLDAIEDVGDPVGDERARAPRQPVHLVAAREQKLGEVRAILPGYARDQGGFHPQPPTRDFQGAGMYSKGRSSSTGTAAGSPPDAPEAGQWKRPRKAYRYQRRYLGRSEERRVGKER